MEIIVEDGTNILDANSYVSVEDAQRYAFSRGWQTTFEDDEKVATALIRAMDYLNSIDNYKGLPTYEGQTLSWPRTGVIVNRIELDTDNIPLAVKAAQVELANAVLNGVELFPNTGVKVETKTALKKSKIGPIEDEFFAPTTATFEQLSLPYIKTLLSGYRSYHPVLRTIRV